MDKQNCDWGVTRDSVFQDHYIIRNLSDKSVICHGCNKSIEEEVDQKRKYVLDM